MKILIVDDQTAMRNYVESQLALLGYTEIVPACDGEEAWKRLNEADEKNKPFQLVISDLMMPKLNGIELVQKIRSESSSDELKNIPFLAATAEGDMENLMDFIEGGADNFLVKPFTKEDLKEKIDDILEKRK